MKQRVAIAISGLAAAAVLAVGLTAAGFAPQARFDNGTAVDAAEGDLTAAELTAASPEPEIVYVKPAPKPKTVVVKKRVKAKASTSSTSTRNVRATRTRGGEREYEHEREHEREDRYEDD